MTVADSTLKTDLWSEVRSKLVSANLETTNSSDNSTRTASINASYNDKAGDRPQVIINPAMVSEDTFKFGGIEGRKAISVVIEVIDKNTEYLDQLGDGIRAAMKANDISGVDLVSIEEDYSFSMPGANKYHVLTITAGYLRE